jgi:hypothetical protein
MTNVNNRPFDTTVKIQFLKYFRVSGYLFLVISEKNLNDLIGPTTLGGVS